MSKRERNRWIEKNSINVKLPKTYNEILQEKIDELVVENIQINKFNNNKEIDETRM